MIGNRAGNGLGLANFAWDVRRYNRRRLENRPGHEGDAAGAAEAVVRGTVGGGGIPPRAEGIDGKNVYRRANQQE